MNGRITRSLSCEHGLSSKLLAIMTLRLYLVKLEVSSSLRLSTLGAGMHYSEAYQDL
jgi:hypothetical protein